MIGGKKPKINLRLMALPDASHEHHKRHSPPNRSSNSLFWIRNVGACGELFDHLSHVREGISVLLDAEALERRKTAEASPRV